MSEQIAQVRVMTWNIHGGGTSRRRRDLDRIVALVRSHAPDIVALQEVDSRPARRGRPVGPAFEILADALGGYATDVRLIAAPDGDYGHALVSRWPLHEVATHDVTLPGREPRAAIETNVETPGGRLHLVAAHLGLSFRERRQQARKLVALSQRTALPSVVLGDFNDWIWRGSVQRALAECTEARTRHKTFPASVPLLALDRIYCRPATLLVRSWTDHNARFASDHLPVIADLDLGASAAGPRDCSDRLAVGAVFCRRIA